MRTMKRLRVLHIYRTYFPETHGGVQEAIRQIALATADEGVDTTIFTLAHDPRPEVLHAPEGRVRRAKSLFEIASCDFGSARAVQACREEAKSADVIHMHYPWPFADLMLPFVRPNGQALVVTYHSDVVRQGRLDKLYAPLRARLLGAAGRIVATSPTYARTSPILARYAAKTCCIPLALADCAKSDASLRERWRSEVGDGFFLFVGVLRYYKGLRFLIEALPAIAGSGARVVIVGDGPLMGELRAQAGRLGVDNVRFLGSLPDADKLALFELCRGVVFPSHLRSEAFGVTLLEGARAGKPLISCEIGTGTSWVNMDDESGLVVPPADPAALAAAINRLHTDDALCRRLGEGARARWETHFRPPVVGKAYADLYRELVSRAV